MSFLPAIEIKNLLKDYRTSLRGVKLRAVDGLSLRVPENSIFGLLGPNGSGKSTTLKILLGLVKPTVGECSVFGHPAGSIEARELVGFLPEAPYFYKHLSGYELVRFYARMSAVPTGVLEARVAETLDLVGMTTAADRRVGTYSKGMLQRIGLAQAIVHDPQLVILDEPTAGVDPLGSAAIGAVLLAMKRRGKTVVLCSHRLGQVEELCDHVAILDKGRLVLEGAIASVLARQEQHVLTVEGWSAAAYEAVKSALEAHNASLLNVEHPRISLEKLFVEKLSRNTGEKTSSFGYAHGREEQYGPLGRPETPPAAQPLPHAPAVEVSLWHKGKKPPTLPQ
ncbi:MAG: ABC transporter ATP-binding protein [Puniceicoccales bacterium]|jgi:ABC-2 type transport system ATP-binding protein|nr:ABC transporter ATP-binding protein [Puniceicoccales bacterium]